MQAFHHKQPFDPAGNVHASSVTRTMKGQSLDTWDMFTRESLQNSWDARDLTSNEDGVSFAIDFNELDTHQVGILRHQVFGDDVEGIDELRQALDSGTIRALAVSDSGTNGLRGPSLASTVMEDSAAPRDFVSFVRNIGRSDSKKLEGGTYGFGKGVFFIASRVSTIVVYTRTVDENNAPVHRFIAMANANDFRGGETLYTGRHWWGLRQTGQSGSNMTEYAEPFTGDHADNLAKALGMDKYFSKERPTGTCIAVLEPDLDDVEDGLREIADSITRWSWPHMARFETDMDPIDFHVAINGREIEVPRPENDPALRQFVQAYKAALDIPSDQKNSWKSDFRHRRTRVFSGKPVKELGRLAVVNLREPVDETHTLLDTTIQQEIALVRGPRMVVEYWRGPKNISGMPYCGVFIADEEADPVFARSEPAAHHEWNYQAIQHDHELLARFWGIPSKNNPVRILTRKLNELLKEAKNPGKVSGDEKHFQSLSDISRRLGSVVSNALGGSDSRVPKRKPQRENTSKPKVGRNPKSNHRLVKMYREGTDIIVVFETDFAVPANNLPISVSAVPYLATDSGTITQQKAGELGIPFPSVSGWGKNMPSKNSDSSGLIGASSIKLTETASKWFVSVRQPEDTATGLKFDFGDTSEVTE